MKTSLIKTVKSGIELDVVAKKLRQNETNVIILVYAIPEKSNRCGERERSSR